MTEIKPEIIVFAGPNGSGKSTITSLLKPPYDYINADEIKATIKCSDLEAAVKADQLRRENLKRGSDFSFETVLSTDRNLMLLKDAKANGYFIKCYYVLTADPAINVARVKLRALGGGHDVPREKIITRYQRAIKLVPDLINTCDIVHVYDNSESLYRIFKKRKTLYYYDPIDSIWSAEDIQHLTGIKDALYRNLNEPAK